MKKYNLSSFLPVLLFSIFIIGCNNTDTKKDKESVAEATSGHPAWSAQSNIYEINLRQFSPAGTIMEFEKALPRLKDMEWKYCGLCPLHP